MYSTIWTQCAGKSKVSELDVLAWRVTENQASKETRKFVDSDDEQHILEDILEENKPKIDLAWNGLEYLLNYCARYKPRFPQGSRFRAQIDSPIWYGALTIETALAEAAFYDLLFYSDTAADLKPTPKGKTSFGVEIKTERGIDLTQNPFSRHEDKISSKENYLESQLIGRDLRLEKIEAWLFKSARCPDRGTNIAVANPGAFASIPKQREHWHCYITKDAAEYHQDGPSRRDILVFKRSMFEVRGKLFLPAAA